MDESDCMKHGHQSMKIAEVTTDAKNKEISRTGSVEILIVDDDDIISTKRLCGITLWRVTKSKIECECQKQIEIDLTVEALRFASHISFFILILLGIISTHAFNAKEVLDDSELEKTFGNRNICLYFDFYPVPYFAPFLYNIPVIFTCGYGCAAIIRIWISFSEGKIEKWQKKFYECSLGFVIFSTMMFSLCFGVQPKKDDPTTEKNEGHETMIVHTVPFMFLELALAFGQVMYLSI